MTSLTEKQLVAKLKKIPGLQVDGFQRKKRTIVRVVTPNDRKKTYTAIIKAMKGSGFKRSNSKTHSRSAGHIENEQYIIVAKPLMGATEHLKLKATSLCSMAHQTKEEFWGVESDFYRFTSRHQLQESILAGLKQNAKCSAPLVKTFKAYFTNFEKDPFTIKWQPGIDDSVKNEVGKYIGELITGLLAFDASLPGLPRAHAFLIPKSSCFSCIDCVIVDIWGDFRPVSCKFGQPGAAASFLGNILPELAELPLKSFRNFKVLKDLVKISRKTGLTNSKGIIYTWGAQYLDIPYENPVETYYDIVGKRFTRRVLITARAIREKTKDPNILKHLNRKGGYSSVTAYFCSTLNALINEPRVLRFLERQLALKSFYQANLNCKKWRAGTIEYKCVHSSEFDIRMLMKSAYNDMAASQGFLSYRIIHKNEKPTPEAC